MLLARDQADENVEPVALQRQERVGLRFGHANCISSNIYMRQALGDWLAVLSGGLRTLGDNGAFSQESDGGRTPSSPAKTFEPTIPHKKIEDLREVWATLLNGAPLSVTACSDGTIQAATHF
jgi:hypothetical protein